MRPKNKCLYLLGISLSVFRHFRFPKVFWVPGITTRMNQIDTFLAQLAGDNPEQWEKPSTLAKPLGVKPDTINDWCSRYPELLPILRLPGSIRIHRCDLVAFLRKINSGEIK
jgi:hypothetical protein